MHQNAAGNGRFARQGAVVSIFRLLNFPGTCTLKQIELIWNISRHRCIDSNCNRAVYWLHERASLSQLSVEALVVVFIITRSQPSFLFPLPPPLTTTPPTHTHNTERKREKKRERDWHTHTKRIRAAVIQIITKMIFSMNSGGVQSWRGNRCDERGGNGDNNEWIHNANRCRREIWIFATLT